MQRPLGQRYRISAGGAGKDNDMALLTATRSAVSSKTGTIIASVFLGAFFVYVVSFSPVEAIHNAAHDTRHSVTAPCH